MGLTLLFDTQGTLVDNYAISEVIEPYVFESHTANDIAADWRFQQKWAMFYTTLADAFVPLPELNKAALRWALEKHHVELEDSDIDAIAAQYHRLRAYPEVLEALASLKQQGHTLKIVANPSLDMIKGHSDFAGTAQYLDDMISNGDEVQRFKPHPDVFQLGIDRAGCPKDEILWVTGHFWEIVGAHRQGLRTAWINRARMPRLDIGVTATYTTRNLQELADQLAAERAEDREAVVSSPGR
jgi:2-haloacid dehalogenase